MPKMGTRRSTPSPTCRLRAPFRLRGRFAAAGPVAGSFLDTGARVAVGAWSVALIDRSAMAKSAFEKAREAPGSTKARILAAAEEVFAARGFEGASTREIAARAGVNISSLHYHWESKETLYFAVFRNVFDRIVDLLQNTLAPLL